MQVRAKKPSTTLGMPARTSRIGLSTARTRGLGVLGQVDGGAQAERAATTMAMPVTMRLPTSSVLMLVAAAAGEPAVGPNTRDQLDLADERPSLAEQRDRRCRALISDRERRGREEEPPHDRARVRWRRGSPAEVGRRRIA